MEGSTGRFCTKCGTKVDQGISFCGKCGADMREQQAPSPESAPPAREGIIRDELRPCPACGEVLSPEITFCTKCGTDVTGPAVQPAPPPPKPRVQHVSGGGAGGTFIIILPRILGGIAAILIIFSCFLPWIMEKEYVFGFNVTLTSYSLPLFLIGAEIFLAILAVALVAARTQTWYGYLIVALYALALEVYFFGAGLDFSEWTLSGAFDNWDIDMEIIKYAAIGFYLNFAGAILLILNIIFAPMSGRAAFRRYVAGTAKWDY